MERVRDPPLAAGLTIRILRVAKRSEPACRVGSAVSRLSTIGP
jgi:hypothetical protein